MERKGFERISGLTIESISEVDFGYQAKMEGCTNISLDIPKLCEIVVSAHKKLFKH